MKVVALSVYSIPIVPTIKHVSEANVWIHVLVVVEQRLFARQLIIYQSVPVYRVILEILLDTAIY